MIPFQDEGIGIGVDISLNIKETNIFFEGDIKDFNIKSLDGYRIEYSGALTISGIDVGISNFGAVTPTGTVHGLSIGIGLGAFPYWLSGNINYGITTVK